VSERPRLLDLFCGAGGSAVGYYRAGFDVTGVDIEPQPHYPFAFIQADALEHCAAYGHRFDAIHASPPCQAFTQMSAKWRGKGGLADSHPDLLTPTRAMLARFSQPWVIENVPGAKRHMRATMVLHGGMFGLGVHRPRLFESNVLLFAPYGRRTVGPIGVYGHCPDGRTLWRYRNNGNMKGKSLIRCARSLEEAQRVMGIDWMDWHEITQAVPPAYTEWIGRHLIAMLERVAA
jgi:DNA (cytosine-5)-methyltransferase 1